MQAPPESSEPQLLRGLVAHWPAVRAGHAGPRAMAAYLRQHWQGARVGAWVAPPEVAGRFGYTPDLSGFNFERRLLGLDAALDQLLQQLDEPAPPSLYIGSTTVDTCLPGFRAANALDFGARQPLASLWLGNRSRVPAHQDPPDNLACVVAGRRRFTLFPPDQVGNLYIGPLDFTPAGQPISLVDPDRPDPQRHPRYASALRQARVFELEPGDALLVPSLWWHQVEALDGLNLLVNYWWRSGPAHLEAPLTALWCAMLAVRDLPPAQRQAWRALFAHYVFEADADTAAHIPPSARRLLAPLDPDGARQLRAQILTKLQHQR